MMTPRECFETWISQRLRKAGVIGAPVQKGDRRHKVREAEGVDLAAINDDDFHLIYWGYRYLVGRGEDGSQFGLFKSELDAPGVARIMYARVFGGGR